VATSASTAAVAASAVRKSGSPSIGHALSQLGREGPPCAFDGFGVRVEGEHGCGVLGDAERESAVAAAKLEHTSIAEVGESTQRCDVGAFRVEQLGQREPLIRVACRP